MKRIAPWPILDQRGKDANAAGWVTKTIDGLTKTTQYKYNDLGQQTETIDPLTRTSKSEYNAAGWVTKTIDALTKTTQLKYNDVGQMTESIDPLTRTTKYEFDAAGRQTKVIDPLTKTTLFAYNDNGEVTQTIDAGGSTSQTAYDAAGRVTQASDGAGKTTQYKYNDSGDLTEVVNPLTFTSKYEFDAGGRQTKAIDGLTKTTLFYFDDAGRQTKVVDPVSATTQYQFDARDQMTRLIDPNGNTTAFGYDAAGNKTSQIDPLTQTQTWSYDANNRQTQTIDRNTRTIAWAYDDDGYLTSEVHYNAGGTATSTLSYSYNANGKMLTAANGNGTYTLSYDDDGQVTQVLAPFGITLGFAYDAGGQRTLVTDSKGGTTSSTYDDDGRLSRQTFTDGTKNLRMNLTYAAAERQRLGATMPATTITACLDENFHGSQPCLVAVEPHSNFLLLEAYHPQRDGDTWTAAVEHALDGLPVTVVQVTSDQAQGLLACARDGLAAQHTPDLFHGQRDLSRAVAGPLARQTQTAEQELPRACQHSAGIRQEQAQYADGPRPPGRPPDFAGRLALSENYQRYAAGVVTQCQERQEHARAAVRGLGDDYHPFDARTGQPQSAPLVQQRLEQRVQQVDDLVTTAQLGEKRQQALAKVRRWWVPLVASLSWFWEMAEELLGGLKLSAAQQGVVRTQLLAGRYWEREAGRGRDAEPQQQRRALGTRLVAAAWSESSPLQELSADRRAALARVVGEAVGLFVRSSSCVEGRNGQLSLYHHGQGPLSTLRLQSLTAVHNFVVERADGTTAAERFFGSKPQAVFAWLLERLPELPRPLRRSAEAETAATAA